MSESEFFPEKEKKIRTLHTGTDKRGTFAAKAE